MDGNLVSQREEFLNKTATPNECAETIRQTEPTAEGMTWDPSSLSCYAEFGASDSFDGPCKSCKTCLFGEVYTAWKIIKILC